MSLTRRHALAGTIETGAATSLPSRSSRAQVKPVLRLGVLNDQSGASRSGGGPGSVACVHEAIRQVAGPLG